MKIIKILTLISLVSFSSFGTKLEETQIFYAVHSLAQENAYNVNPSLGWCFIDVSNFLMLLERNNLDINNIHVYYIKNKKSPLNLKSSTADGDFLFHYFITVKKHGHEYVFDYLTKTYGLLLRDWLFQELKFFDNNYVIKKYSAQDFMDYFPRCQPYFLDIYALLGLPKTEGFLP